MFSNRVYTQFNGETGRKMFPYVDGDDVVDGALISVLRAVLADKIGENKLTVDSRTMDSSDQSARAFHDSITSGSDTLVVVNYSSSSRFPEWLLSDFEDVATEKGFVRINRITSFYDKLFDVALYVNEKIKTSIIFIGRLDVSRMHYVTTTLFAWLPWYFPKEGGVVTSLDKELMKSLKEVTQDKFVSTIGLYEAKYDFYALRIAAMADVEEEWVESEIRNMRNEIENLESRITSAYQNLSEMTKKRMTLQKNLSGWLSGNRDKRRYTVKDYLVDNRESVHMISVSESGMYIQTKAKLMYFDEDSAKNFIEGGRNPLSRYRPAGAIISADEMKELFNALFIERTAELWFCAGYYLNVSGNRVDAQRDFDFDYAAKNCCPNPHINKYRCIGGYEQAFINAMSAGNYIGAIEQCIASCASLNFDDGTVLEYFVPMFYTFKAKCIEINGELYTIKEAVSEIKKQKGEEQNEQ